MPSLPSPLARIGRRALLGAAGVLAGLRRAAAHAVVVASDPPAGAALAVLPAQVSVRFNSRIDQARSRLALIGPDGEQVVLDLAPATAPALLEAAIPAPSATPAGAWRLRWQVLAVDGHITRGDIPFTIEPR